MYVQKDSFNHKWYNRLCNGNLIIIFFKIHGISLILIK